MNICMYIYIYIKYNSIWQNDFFKVNLKIDNFVAYFLAIRLFCPNSEVKSLGFPYFCIESGV